MIILRRLFSQQLKNKIEELRGFNVIIRTEFYSDTDSFLCELNFKKQYSIKSNQIDKIQFNILFNYEGEIEIEIKKPYLNQIFYLDKEKYAFQKFKRIDFNYFLCLIDNILCTELI
jgi:DNA polymerase elongation subunit (family B)